MKKTICTMAMLIASVCAMNAAKPANNDTIPADNAKIEKVIVDETTNSKGNPTTKYYFIYDGELVPTNKTTVEHWNLSQKHGTKCKLAVIMNKNTKRKRIALN